MKSLYIDGSWTEGSGPRLNSTNPANGEVLWRGSEASTADVDGAVNAATKAFAIWSKTSFEKRLAILEKYCGLIEQDKVPFAELISSETGKPYWECLLEVGAMIGKLGHSVKSYKERCSDNQFAAGDAQAVLRFRAIGVMVVFGPFNLPAHLPNGHIVPALLAGNTVIFKPSEQTPASGQKLVELMAQAGLPQGVLNMVQGGRATGEALTAHKGINGVLFTGSYRVGKILHQQFAGRPEIMLALEMGGNNPLVVAEVKDFKAAAYLTIQSAFITTGQRCVCARRLIVPRGLEGDAFLETLVEMTGGISYGDPANRPEPFMGPVISAQAGDGVVKAYNNLIAQGATALFELQQNDSVKALISPAIVDVTGLSLPDEEIFGPLLQVIRVKDAESALDEANNTSFGLSAGIVTDNKELYLKFLDSSRAGIINWNRQITGAVSSNPFGGSGHSGNYRPSAYFAADYCAYPVASIEKDELTLPETFSPGIQK